MILYHKGMPSVYEIENIVRLFFLYATVENRVRSPKQTEYCFVRRHKSKLFVGIRINGQTVGKQLYLNEKEDPEFSAVQNLFSFLSTATGKTPSWGMLTGVRPVSFLRSLAQKGQTKKEIETQMRETYKVSSEKLNLAFATQKAQEPIIQNNTLKSYSLYISIPFCPTRCSYCSFVSRTTQQDGHLIPNYIEALCNELQDTGRLAQKQNLQLKTVYIGGGTPTTLEAAQLQQLITTLYKWFPMHEVEEFTVEAGRPDTLTKSKLEVLKAGGVTRLSINTQTLNNEILYKIGRPHTAEDYFDSMKLAREMGFQNINTDLIAGLPGDTPESFAKTIDGILKIQPENVTVHTLTLKRASNIVIDQAREEYADVAQMLLQNEKLLKSGYIPYYLYRQKNTLQNLENTGFTKPGKECLYNVYIMEEIHTILSCGAGGSTKLKKPGQIERVFNYKYPSDYIKGYEKIQKKNQRIEEFYAGNLDT